MSNIERDVQAMAYNYFYNGWSYRLESEGHTAVAKDSNDAADRVIKEYREQIRKELLDEQSKARQEKLNATEEAVVVT